MVIIQTYAVSVNDVEKLSGIDFFPSLPDTEEETLESQFDVSLWDLSDFNRTKTAQKYGYDLESAGFIREAEPVSIEPQGIWETVLFFLYTNFGEYKKSIVDMVVKNK